MDLEDTFFANQGEQPVKVEETPKAEEAPKEQPKEEVTPQPEAQVEEPTETPQEETIEPSSLNTETTQEAEPQKQPQEPTPSTSAEKDDVFDIETVEDLASFASEQFGMNLSAQQLQDLSEGKSAEPSYANDTVKELNDYVAQGGSINDFLEFKMTDYDSMNELELVYRKMQKDYPSLTSEQIQRRLNKKFMLDEEQFDDDERQDGLIDLNIAAQDARKYFKEQQSKYATPFQDKSPQQQPATQEPEFSEEELKAFQSDMQNSVSNLKSIEFGGATYEVSDSLRNKINEMPADIGDLFVEGDSFNFDKYNQLRAIAADPEAYAKTLIEQGKTLALQEIKNNRNNTTLEPETHKPSGVVDSKKAQESLIQEYMGGGNKYTF